MTEKTKKLPALALALTLFVTAASGFVACSPEAEPQFSPSVKNVVLVIGDGMGENHIQNALTYFELTEPEFFKDRHGSLATHSANSPITDSAAAATALATGVKVDNGEIARHGDENLTSISELAKAAGKKVGVITTDVLSGATPSAFSAHADNRGDTDDIAATQAVSNIDLLIGETGDNAYYGTYRTLFEENGYIFAQSETELLQNAGAAKLITTLPEVRSKYNAGNEEDYQLSETVRFALDFLENDEGFFLMVESAHIDKFSHGNELIPALCEVRSLFDTMEVLYDFAADGETAILLTADHETGWLEKAEYKQEISNELYENGGHSARDVPFYVKNFTLEETEFSPQNTEVFTICKKILGV